MKVTVYIDMYTARQIKGEVEAISDRLKSKRFSAKKYGEVFAQDIIDRYFSVEWLDAESLGQSIE